MYSLANVIIIIIKYKERKMSMIYSPINRIMFYGIACETFIFIILMYVPGLNKAFGGRPLDILNLGYILS